MKSRVTIRYGIYSLYTEQTPFKMPLCIEFDNGYVKLQYTLYYLVKSYMCKGNKSF